MKKPALAVLCLALSGMMLCGCAPQSVASSSAQPYLPPSTSSSGAPKSSAPKSSAPESISQNTSGETLSIVLPAHMAGLEEELQKLAAADGNTLNFRAEATGTQYIEETKGLLDSEQAPDIIWVQNEMDFGALGGEEQFTDMQSVSSAPAFAALAGMAPRAGRLGKPSAVYGLPMGDYAYGYLVNIELLGALLGTKNYTALQNNLADCTFKQWSALSNALEQYLARPGRMRLALGNTTYQTPDYRPKEAQSLRGMYAFADADTQALCQGVLVAATQLVQKTNAQGETAAERQLASDAVLTSLFEVLNSETMHMARREGVFRRGAEYAERDEKLSAEEAKALFAEGIALFLRADSRAGFALEDEYPALAGKLALVPLKFAPPPVAQSAASEEETQKEDAPATQEIAVAALIEEQNHLLWRGGSGYLLLPEKAKHSAAAQALLLRLFASEEGIKAIQNTLHVQPFSDLAPSGPLALQVGQAATGGMPITLQSGVLARAEENIGAYVRDELMAKDEWSSEDTNAFLAVAKAALASLTEENTSG